MSKEDIGPIAAVQATVKFLGRCTQDEVLDRLRSQKVECSSLHPVLQFLVKKKKIKSDGLYYWVES
ncbi:hypothetical protein [Piscirickettsia litoralis]|uniref:Uncharacterized protein n=1 Tax=Piscirickettsia litoralis TaxID=1891921 RepID=A0ABX2ZXI9_9GAMM|nr:hypothetical protein [Piscirickettsia litoralis]ODN41094.1 hypothetical protein BGC07_18280 [Piscirickettsia litoralis]